MNKTKNGAAGVAQFKPGFFFHWDEIHSKKAKQNSFLFFLKKKDAMEIFFMEIRVTWPKIAHKT